LLKQKKLTKRQVSVMELIVRGWTYKEIAMELDITYKTVSRHLMGARSGLKARTTNQAVYLYIEYLANSADVLRKVL